jgi:hypothetical protein
MQSTSQSTSLRRTATLITVSVVLAAFLSLVSFASADSTPIGKLPAGPIVKVTAARDELVSIALPRPVGGKVWRIARTVDSKVLRQVSEGTLSSGPVVVFRAVGQGHAVVRFALTSSDASAKALASRTLEVTVLG